VERGGEWRDELTELNIISERRWGGKTKRGKDAVSNRRLPDLFMRGKALNSTEAEKRRGKSNPFAILTRKEGMGNCILGKERKTLYDGCQQGKRLRFKEKGERELNTRHAIRKA